MVQWYAHQLQNVPFEGEHALWYSLKNPNHRQCYLFSIDHFSEKPGRELGESRISVLKI